MSNGDHWMPLYVTDYLGDTMGLSTLQHGAYLLLLMHYWRTGPLPSDQEELASIAKVETKAWPAIWAKLGKYFTENGDGTLHQKRMDWERRRWTEISDKRRDAGKRGAEAKHRSRPNGGGGSSTPSPEPAKEQPKVVQAYISPSPAVANAMAIARNQPVDNLANARNLPGDLPPPLPENSGNCHPFATRFASVPSPSQREESISFLGKEAARESEATKIEGGVLDRHPDRLEELLKGLPPLPKPFEQRHHPDVQKAAVTKPVRPKACYLEGPTLLAMRKLAGIPVAAS